jgi:hypothetical protein
MDMGFSEACRMGMVRGITILVALLTLVLGGAVPCVADPFSLSGNWKYRRNGGEVADTTTNFSQSYNLNFAKQLSSAMNLSSSVRYNDSHASEGRDSNSLNPSASLNLRNDFFTLSLSGTESRTDSDGSVPLDNKSWGANLYTHLDNWPGLRLSYNQSTTSDDQNNHAQDTESRSLGASVDYSLVGFDLLYDFRMGKSEDLVEDTTSDTLNHYAQLKYSESFFRSRLSISASRQYSRDETETDSSVSPVFLLAGFSGEDDTPENSDLTNNSALVDGTLDSSERVVIQKVADVQNVAIQVSDQKVSQLLIYFNSSDSSISDFDFNKLEWTLYESSNNEKWDELSIIDKEEVNSNPGLRVVKIEMKSKDFKYLKVVIKVSSELTEEIFVTEIDAGVRRMSGDRKVTKTTFVSHQTQLSLSYRPAPAWSTGYSMRRVLNLPDSGLDSTQTSHTVNASYAPNQYFSMALGASQSTNKVEHQDASRSRTYSAAFNSSPLPVLDLSLGYTRTHGYEGGDEISRSDLINGNLAAEIFPDLTLGFSPTWSRSRALDTGGETTSYGYSLTSTARLSPRLTLTAHWNYDHSDTDTATADTDSGVTTSRQYGGTLSYRPSDVLLLSCNFSQDLDSDSTSMNGTLAWLLTRYLQIHAGADFTFNEEDTERYNSSLTWTISRNLSLQGAGNYQVADSGDLWNFTTSLNANY